MFSNEQNENTLTLQNHKFDRVVIGAGALGLFLSSVIQNEFPNSNLTIISKSLPNQPVFIHNLQEEIKETKFPEFFLVGNLDSHYPSLNKESIIFYICTPPETNDLSFQYINDLIKNLSGKKNIYLVFLNNGIIDYQLFNELENSFSKKKFLSFFLIRAIVVSGIMRSKFPDKTIIKNTSGNKIYFGIFQKSLPINYSYILPMGYFKWIFSKDIFNIERSKFLINFILGLCIGAKEIPNSNIFKLLPEEKRKEIFINFCTLFSDNTLSPYYLEKYFNDTIENTASNINSVSLSWYHGNKKPIEYFLACIEKMAYLNDNKEVLLFFKNLIHFYS